MTDAPLSSHLFWFEIQTGSQIVRVPIERYTDHYVWYCGRKYSRAGWRRFFPTWKEAHACLLEKAEKELQHARRALQLAQSHYGNIKGMSPS